MRPFSNVKKRVNLFSAILITVMISACAEQQKTEVQPSSVSSQPVIFQVPVDQTEQSQTGVPTPKKDRKVLYALDENQRTKPLTQIPYYRQGKSEPLPEIVFKQFSEGHQPWLSNPVTVALVNCSNLISSEGVDTLQNKAEIGEKKIVIDSDRIITEVNTEDKDIQVVMSKPGGITYDITMFTPQGTGVLFVKQIIENPPSE